MTPSKRGDGLGNGPLLASAPVTDPETGLHSEECECARCQLGFGPTREDRWAARAALARAAQRRKAASEAAKVRAKLAEKAAVTAELLKGEEADTKERMRAALAPVERPATAEELAELKREFGLERRRTHR